MDSSEKRTIFCWTCIFFKLIKKYFFIHRRRSIKSIFIRVRQPRRSIKLNNKIENIESPQKEDCHELIDKDTVEYICHEECQSQPSLVQKRNGLVKTFAKYPFTVVEMTHYKYYCIRKIQIIYPSCTQINQTQIMYFLYPFIGILNFYQIIPTVQINYHFFCLLQRLLSLLYILFRLEKVSVYIPSTIFQLCPDTSNDGMFLPDFKWKGKIGTLTTIVHNKTNINKSIRTKAKIIFTHFGNSTTPTGNLMNIVAMIATSRKHSIKDDTKQKGVFLHVHFLPILYSIRIYLRHFMQIICFSGQTLSEY